MPCSSRIARSQPESKRGELEHVTDDQRVGTPDEPLNGWLPEFLEAADAALTEQYGPRWWEALGLTVGVAR